MKNAFKLTILCITFFLGISLESCMQAFKMNDASILKYYTEKPPLPAFSYTDTLGYKIHYAHSKSDSLKSVLLLIHGAPGAWFGYKDFFNDKEILNRFEVIAPDRSGYNKSNGNLTDITLHAQAISPLFSLKSQSKYTVVGRSYGAAIAAKLVVEHPSRVDRLILIAPACDPTKEKFWWFSKPVNTKFVRFFLPKYANRASDEKFAHIESLKKILPDWQKIKCPVTILQGGKDWIIEPSNGRFVDSVLKNAPRRFIQLPQNGHLLTEERFDLVKQILLE
jgi:pimeloyl-ACP methyl ester carboxylesterase